MIAHLFLFMLKIIYIHEKKKCFPPLHEFQIVSSIQKGLNELAGVSKWAGTRYFYPSEIVYSTGRNYWTSPKISGGQNHKYDWLVEYFS